MKILVTGCKGSMGKRYTAILNHLGVEYIGIDAGDKYPALTEYDRVIICTPTENHFVDCVNFASNGKNFLCEKPISKKLEHIKIIDDLCNLNTVSGYMVNNWAFVFKNRILEQGKNKISYDFYNTGKDDLLWDCIQLVGLAENEPKINVQSPVFKAYVNEQKITMEDIQKSYIRMIQCWIDLDKHASLWSIKDAYSITQKVLKYFPF